MANQGHLDILKQGVEAWNEWRASNPEVKPDFIDAELSFANLSGANLYRADLTRATLFQTNLTEANLSEADLTMAYLTMADLAMADLTKATLDGAILTEANLSGASLFQANLFVTILFAANLSKANLFEANLSRAHLGRADLTGANLTNACVVDADLGGANLTACGVYGISAWNLKVNKETRQSGLIITKDDEPVITVDDLEVAQFIYLLLNREKLRNIINTVTSKAVLILGRFTPERKAVLDAIADELRKHNLLPIIFDFERATSRDFTETIKTLAGMSLFVIADITNPKSAPLELQATVPDYQIPFVPIVQEGEKPFSMFSDLTKYPWVLTVLEYPSPEGLIAVFDKAIIERAFDKYKELLKLKARGMETISVKDFLGEPSKNPRYNPILLMESIKAYPIVCESS